MDHIATAFSYIWNIIKNISFIDIIDIAIVAFVFYYVYKFIRERRAGKLAAGILILLLIFCLSNLLNMYAMKFILQNVFQVGIIALIIVFQPELRSALEKVGAEPLKSLRSIGESKSGEDTQTIAMINEVTEAVCDMSLDKTGALIVIERSTKLGDIIKSGTVINANPTSFLIRNIFFNKAPLHDGAMVIRDARLHAAGCFLPLSTNNDIIKDLGTRHRAAIGMSENSDAVILVVSEETGTISMAIEGQLKRNFSYNSLKSELTSLLITNTQQNVRPSKRVGKLLHGRGDTDDINDGDDSGSNDTNSVNGKKSK
ncbi:MAG: TIGR00159 family protein [Clostridiales bacterium]|nr:TIGR00159 family protein [Clostridiales bacterium]